MGALCRIIRHLGSGMIRSNPLAFHSCERGKMPLTNWRAFFRLGIAKQIWIARLGMNANNKKAKENASKNKKVRLIRLDDLIPKKNVVGGRQLLFGVTDTQRHQSP
jgi:hypothetical protein